MKYSIDVVFRKWPDGTIDALMPYESEVDYKVTCYSRIGQHCQADYDYVVSKTKLASEDEYRPLLNELLSLDYEVRVIKKANKTKMIELQRALNRTLSTFSVDA